MIYQESVVFVKNDAKIPETFSSHQEPYKDRWNYLWSCQRRSCHTSNNRLDMSLSRYQGKKCPTCHNIIENWKLVTNKCQKRYSTREKCYTVEVDLVPENYPYIVE